MDIKIREDEIKLAKERTIEFDKIKTFNKFPCKNNYIGLLGEIVFNRYLTENKIEHEWIEFVKKGYKSPDFIINGKTFDLKTTKSSVMWFQKPIYDVYIYAQVNDDIDILTIHGWVTKESLLKMIESDELEIVTRKEFNRTDYIIRPEKMVSHWFNIILGVD